MKKYYVIISLIMIEFVSYAQIINEPSKIVESIERQSVSILAPFTNNCTTPNFITKSSGLNGNLTCSQIFDDGTSVGIGTNTNFGYTINTQPPSYGIVSLDVNGVTRTSEFYIVSDKKFKKDIKPIDSALDKIMQLEGKTYNMRKDEFKDKNFASELQYGLIAQDVQKVIPSLVIASENGDLAMNYIGLIPVLIEAVKEQNKINENRMSQSVLAPFTNNCTTPNFITKASGLNGNLTCSQIFDDGTSVGIGAIDSFNIETSPGVMEVLRLRVNGASVFNGFFLASDKKFKKDIKPIESALDKIMSLEGKTYNWRKDEFKDKNFTSELQYGLLAQDVQKVIPSLVIESENGDLAMNYTGLIPVLIEAFKEQNKINENRMSQSVLAPFTNNCTTPNFITKASGLNGNLTCSQIFDNGTSVGIGSSSNFGYTYSPGDFSASMNQLSGTITLDVSGVTRSLGFYATSDKKFKKDIKPIESALDKIMSLEGKTYNWRKDEFKDKNFTSELQYGLLAQDVQKVIPSLVIESENGELAMNYTGLIPVLIEALKEQQVQISELKQQLTDNFKAQNQDLLQFSNTKIISVSPNPSNDIITVSVNLEKEVQSAALQVHDINGNVLSNLNLKERANNVTKTLQKDNFGKGIYIVSLVINGKSIDSKKIVFN